MSNQHSSLHAAADQQQLYQLPPWTDVPPKVRRDPLNNKALGCANVYTLLLFPFLIIIMWFCLPIYGFLTEEPPRPFMSSPETAVDSGESAAVSPTALLKANGESLSVQPDNVFFGDQIQLVQYDIEERHGWLTVRLHWAPLAEWPEYLHVGVDAEDVAGNVVHIGRPLLLGDEHSADSREDLLALWPRYEFPVMVAQEGVENGRCRIILSLRDGSMSEPMAVTAADATRVIDNGTALLLADWAC